jgi:hypothetical protein
VGRSHYNVPNRLAKSMEINFLMYKQCWNVIRSLQVQNDCIFFTLQWLQKSQLTDQLTTRAGIILGKLIVQLLWKSKLSWRLLPYGTWCCVVWYKFSDVAKGRVAFHFSVEEAALSTVKSLNFYQTLQCHITEEYNIQTHHRENLDHRILLLLCSARCL